MIPIVFTVGLLVWALSTMTTGRRKVELLPPTPSPVIPPTVPRLPSLVPKPDVIEKGKEKVTGLVGQPDKFPHDVPIIDGKPAWFQVVTATGQKVPITRTGTGLDVRPTFTVISVVFRALQDVVGVKQDARIGDITLGAFKNKIRKRGFTRYPTTVAMLAANAVKYTEILRKNIPPAKVGGVGRTKDPWTDFARAMAAAEMDEIGHNGRLGHFALSPRRLEQLGLMENVHPVLLGDENLYTGDCIGFELDEFLNNPRMQLAIFCKSIKDHIKQIKADPRLNALIGRQTPYGTVTMNGLLALANMAGLKSAASWILKPKDAVRFPATT